MALVLKLPVGTGGGVTTFEGMTDTNFTGLAEGNLAVYDFATSKWVNKTLAAAGIEPANANIQAHIISDGSDHSFINQAVTNVASPTFIETNVDAIQLDIGATVAHAEGKIHFNADLGMPEAGSDDPAIALFWNEATFKVKNTSGSAITSLQAVRPTGASGSNPTVSLANANSVATSRPVGLIRTASINNNGVGFVCIMGRIEGVNTSAWADGTVLYLGTTDGALTSTPPSFPNSRIRMCVVVNSHATDGAVIVDTAVEYDIDQDLNIGAAPVLDGSNFTNVEPPISRSGAYELLHFNIGNDGITSSDGLKTNASGYLGIGGAPTAPLDIIRSDASVTSARIYNSNGAPQGVNIQFKNWLANWSVGNNTSGQFYIYDNVYIPLLIDENSPHYSLRVASSGRVGHGLLTPLARLHVLTPTSNTDPLAIFGSVDDGDLVTIDSAGGLYWGSAANDGIYGSSAGNLRIKIAGTDTFAISTNTFQGLASNGPKIVNETASATNPVYGIGASTTGMGGAAGEVSLITGSVEALRITAEQSHHFPEITTPTPIANYGSIYPKADNMLYFQDGAGVEHVAAGASTPKSYTFASRSAASGTYFVGGFYNAPAADANLTNASTTVVLGSANGSYAAHAFIVSGGNGTTDGSDLVLTVTGTSMTDAGVRTTSDSEVVEATAGTSALNSYYETGKKWVGQVTYTLSSTGGTTFSYDFNYGFCKYDDLHNRDFTITDFEVVGLCNATDTDFNIELLKHSDTGWTYSAAAFVAGNSVILNQNTVHGAESDIIAGEPFSFKHGGLATAISGTASEGYLVRITTGTNNAISYMTVHVDSVI